MTMEPPRYHTLIEGTVLTIVFLALAAAIYGASIVAYAPLSAQFGTGPEGYTYLLAASALGSVLAAFLAERLAAPRLHLAVPKRP